MSSKGLGARLLLGAGAAFLIQGAGQALQFGLHVLLARRLGPTEYGLFAFAASWIAVLAIVSQWGIPKSALRTVSSTVAAGRDAARRGFARWSRRRLALASSAATIGLLVSVAVLSASGAIDGDRRRALFAAAAVLVPAAWLATDVARLRGAGRVVSGLATSLVLQPVAFIVLFVVTVALLGTADARSALVARALATLLAALVAAGLIWRRFRRVDAADAASDDTDAAEWHRITASLWWVGSFQLVWQNADLLVLSAFASSARVGEYAVAIRIAGLLAFGLTAIAAWSAPMLARLRVQGDDAGLQQLVTLSARGATAFSLAAALALLVGGDRLVALFGAGFDDALPILWVLVVGQLANAATGPVGYVLTMADDPGIAARVEAWSALLVVVLAVGLVAELGALGAAIAASARAVFRNGWMAWFVWRRTGIRALPW